MAWQMWVLAAQIILGGVLVTVGTRLAALLAKGTAPAPPLLILPLLQAAGQFLVSQSLHRVRNTAGSPFTL